MAPAYVSHSVASAAAAALPIPKPTGTVNNHVMLAFIYSNQGSYPVVPPDEDWETIYTPLAGTFAPGVFCKRAGGAEGDEYTFTAQGSTLMAGYIVTVSGCDTTGSPVGGYAGLTGYAIYDTKLYSYESTTTEPDVLLVFMGMGWSDGLTATPPDGYNERIDTVEGAVFLYAADCAQADVGPSDPQWATLNKPTAAKYAVLVPLTGPRSLPSTPEISEPEALAGAAPGALVDLTATATDPTAQQVKYRWKYSLDGGADVSIGETALVNSGTPETYVWDTDGLVAGAYTLKCWSVDASSNQSAEYSSVLFYLQDAVITAPAEGDSRATGMIWVAGKGYAAAAGDIILDWERDTNCPPDPASDAYESWASDELAQGEVDGDYRLFGLGTWCLRARTAQALGYTRYNRCAYPSFEVDSNDDGLSNGWTSYAPGGSPAWSRPAGRQQGYAQRYTDTGQAGDGTDRYPLMHQTGAGAVTNGGDVTVSLYAKGAYTGCTVYLMLQIRDSSGTNPLLYGTPVELTGLSPTEWKRYNITYPNINHASASSVLAYIWVSDWHNGDTVDLTIDDVLLERTTTVEPYFDGDYYGASWAYGAHQSVSSTTYACSDWTTLQCYVLETLRLLAGSEVKHCILKAANKIFAKVKGTAIIEEATYNVPGDPMAYDASPREDLVLLPDGDSAGAQAVAGATLARRRVDQDSFSGLGVALADGLKLERGRLVGLQIDRMDVSGTYPVRELLFDIASGACAVTLGDWQAPKDDIDTLVDVAQTVDRLEREGA